MRNPILSLKAMTLGIATTLAVTSAASADSWSLAHMMPADSSEGQVHQKFAELVAEYTNGDIEVNVFPASQLGQAPELLQQLESGVIQIYVEGTGSGNQYIPELNWISAPFLFDSNEHWQRFLQSGAMKEYYDQLEAEHNITIIGDPTIMARGPFRTIVTKEPFNGLEDLQGMKLRMFESKFHIDVWSYLGAEPIVLGWSDVYESLRNGVVEAVTSPVSLVEPMKFYEQAPNVARTDEYPQALSYMVNTQAWENLSQENRDAIDRAYNEAAVLAQEFVSSQIDGIIADFGAKGVEYVEIDTSEFTSKMEPFYQEMVEAGELPAGIFEGVKATR